MFSDAVDREAAWLGTSGDGLPALKTADGGPFQILQARWPRTPSTAKTGLYVLRSPSMSYHVDRYAAPRSLLTTQFLLRLMWPLSSGTGSAEGEQLNFEQAVDLVLARIMGPLIDKTHGGRFLSAGEGRSGITVNYLDPEEAVRARTFGATITYSADDPEIAN